MNIIPALHGLKQINHENVYNARKIRKQYFLLFFQTRDIALRILLNYNTQTS